jgi:hypothetical protein
MTIETIAFLSLMFAATTLAAMAYERQMDVLYGTYLPGRAHLPTHRFWEPLYSAADRMRRKARDMIYYSSASRSLARIAAVTG